MGPGEELRSIGQLVTPIETSGPSPLDSFFEGLDEAIDRNTWSLAELVPPDLPATYLKDLSGRVREAVSGARDFFGQEVQMYQDALDEAIVRRNEFEQTKKFDKARGIAGFISFLQQRVESLQRQDWVSFFSDRGVLPGYAFPIYNVTLATTNSELKLERDLRFSAVRVCPGRGDCGQGTAMAERGDTYAPQIRGP